MAKPTTSIDEVAEAVEAVKNIQRQVIGLIEAVDRLTKRSEALEKRLDAMETQRGSDKDAA